MAKVTGFLDYERVKQPYRPISERIHDWNQVMAPWDLGTAENTGCTLHGLRHPFLSRGLSIRQPDT